MAIRLARVFLLVSFLALLLADRAFGIGRLPELAIGERIAAASDGRAVARLGLLEQQRWQELEELRADVERSQRAFEANILRSARSEIAGSAGRLNERIDRLASDQRWLLAGTVLGLVSVAILSYRIGRLRSPSPANVSTSAAALVELLALERAVSRIRETKPEIPPIERRSRAPLRKVG